MKKLFGKYKGKVANNLDPKKEGRIKAFVPKAGFVTFATEWAEPNQIIDGAVLVPNINTKVWIEFEGGDPNSPIWTGIFYGSPGGKSEVPLRAQGTDDGTEAFKGTDSIVLPSGTTNEPTSDFSAIYPQNKVIKLSNGILIEYDNTKGAERVQLFHPTGSFIEMRSDGKVVSKCADRLWLTVGVDFVQHVLGKKLVRVEGGWEEETVGTKLMEATLIKFGKTAVNGLIMTTFGTTKYNVHGHQVTAVGSPTGPPLPPALFVAGTDDTTKVQGE